MQNVSFRNVDEFLAYLPENELEIVEALRSIVLDCIPDVKEKLSYNVPYFSRFYRICFIWPASVPWGNVKLNGVQIGFVNGNLLTDESGYLERGNRKQVYTKAFTDVSEIDVEVLRSLIFEAVLLDEEKRKEKLSG